MHKVYGKKGKDTPLPETYNQSDMLMLSKLIYYQEILARGYWTSSGFVLKAESYVKVKHNFEKSKPGIKAIKDELIRNNTLRYYDDEFYILAKDIYFHSPSAAGELVQGHSSNGLLDWKNSNSVTLKDLLNKGKK